MSKSLDFTNIGDLGFNHPLGNGKPRRFEDYTGKYNPYTSDILRLCSKSVDVLRKYTPYSPSSKREPHNCVF